MIERESSRSEDIHEFDEGKEIERESSISDKLETPRLHLLAEILSADTEIARGEPLSTLAGRGESASSFTSRTRERTFELETSSWE